MRLLTTAMVMVAGVLLSACSGTAPMNEAVAPPSSSLDADARVDLSRRLDAAAAVPPEEQATLAADSERLREESVAACMALAGFDYVPFLVSAALTAQLPGAGATDPATFVAQYGFGISTTIDAPPAGMFVPQLPEDPNVAIRAGLSSAETAAYDDMSSQCRIEAERTVPPPPNVIEMPVGADGSTPFTEVERRVDADPRMADANRGWSACMTADGFAFGSPADLQSEITRRTEPFRAPFEARQSELAGDLDAQNRLRLVDVLTPTEAAALAEAQGFEIEAATADQVCSGPLSAVRQAVYDEKLDEYLAGG